MSPTLLQIILNAGKLISVLKDLEKTVADAVAKQNVTADLKQDLTDLVGLVQSGLFTIPGLSAEQLASVVAEIQAL